MTAYKKKSLWCGRSMDVSKEITTTSLNNLQNKKKKNSANAHIETCS